MRARCECTPYDVAAMKMTCKTTFEHVTDVFRTGSWHLRRSWAKRRSKEETRRVGRMGTSEVCTRALSLFARHDSSATAPRQVEITEHPHLGYERHALVCR